MTDQTLLCFGPTTIAWVRELSGVSCLVMVDFPIEMFGQMTGAWEAVRCILEERIAPLVASAKQIVMATSREGTVLDSGVSGVQVMVL